jgi:Kef-type K+ transport system membrane component KefB/mannitol/fructose-specific phosphotransferase system IIA component
VLDFQFDHLFGLALLTVSGLIAGELARRVRLPAVTGQILAGVLFGPSVLGLFDHDLAVALTPLINVALGLIAMAVGSHLHIYHLESASRRLGWLVALEMTVVPLAVFLAAQVAGGGNWVFSVLLGTLAISTAPATLVAIVKEARARGVFISTLMAAVALNNIACILMFEMAFTAVSVSADPEVGLSRLFLAPLVQVAGAVAIGGGVGMAMVLFTRHVFAPDRLATASLVALLFTVGVASAAGISQLLACLFLGATLANTVPEKEEIGHRAFASFEPAILAIFFTVAGIELDLGQLAPAGVLAAVVVGARVGGKVLAGWLAMTLARAPVSMRQNLGWALLPQAGVAVGLLLKVRESAVQDVVGQLFLVVGVSTVMLNEILGPLTTRWAIKRSGEGGKDRPRLIDFLHEYNIVTGFHADSKDDAVGKLVDVLVRSHRLTSIDRDDLVKEVMAREAAMSTCIGRGLFVPHAHFEGVPRLLGAMAINREGLPFETPDGLPVHCIMLLVVPEGERQRHLEVLAALARSIGADPNFQTQLYHAHSPAHVHEILHAEEFEDYNYFLEEEQP